MADRLAEQLNLEFEEAISYVETFMDIVLEALGRGDRIEIRGFGVFQIKEYQERKGRNPRSGAAVNVARRRTVKFKPGKALRDSVREAGFKELDAQRKKSRVKKKART